MSCHRPWTLSWPTWALKLYDCAFKVITFALLALTVTGLASAFCLAIYCMSQTRFVLWLPLSIIICVVSFMLFVLLAWLAPGAETRIKRGYFCALCRSADHDHVRTIGHRRSLFLPHRELVQLVESNLICCQQALKCTIPIRHRAVLTEKLPRAQRKRRSQKHRTTTPQFYTLCTVEIHFVVRPHRLTQQGYEYLMAEKEYRDQNFDYWTRHLPVLLAKDVSPWHEDLQGQLGRQIAAYLTEHPGTLEDGEKFVPRVDHYLAVSFDLSGIKLYAQNFGFFDVHITEQRFRTYAAANAPSGYHLLNIGQYFPEIHRG